MKEVNSHNDPLFDAFKNAFDEYQPEFTADDMNADWSSVQSQIASPQGVNVSKPDVSGGFKSLLNLKNVIITSVAGVAIVATTVIILNKPNNSDTIQSAPKANTEQNLNNIDNKLSTPENNNTYQNVTDNKEPGDQPIQSVVDQKEQTGLENTGSVTFNQQGLTKTDQPGTKATEQPKSNETASRLMPRIIISDKGVPGQNEIYVSDTQFCQSQLLSIKYNLPDYENQKVFVSVNGKALYNTNNTFIYQFPKAGWYNLAMVIQNYGTSGTKAYRMLVVTSPVASFTYNLEDNQSVKFNNLCKYADIYRWQFGDNSSAKSENPVHRYMDTGLYKVELIAASDGVCADTAIKYIRVKSFEKIDIPNTFSPNNDGVNEEFFVRITNETLYELTIFDRNSNLVYSSKDKTEKWTGNYKDSGKPCPPGTYFFFLNYQLAGQDQPAVKSGTITLFR
jgi:gliding motility-associated-like protein